MGYGYGLPYAHGVAYAGVPFGSSTGLTPSPRVLMPPPRDTLLTPTATSDTDTDTSATTARGPLMPRLTPTTLVAMPSPTLPTVSLPPLSPSDLPPVWTPSPRALMHPPRDTFPTPMATSDTTTVKF